MKALGIDLKWLIFQLINFGVLLIGLTYLLHKPIVKLLDSRKKEINESLKAAGKMKAEVVKFEDKQGEILKEARKEAEAILNEVKKESKTLEAKLTANAQEKANSILEKSKEDIKTEKARLKKDLESEIAKLVVEASEKVLDEDVDVKFKKQDITKAIKELEKIE